MIKSYVLQTLISKMPKVNLIDNLRVTPSKHLIEFTYQGHILKVFRPNPDGLELRAYPNRDLFQTIMLHAKCSIAS